MAKKILIIDDDPTSVKLVEGRLKENGYNTIVSFDAALGLEMAIKQQPDLVILDVMMPIINGYNLCTILKGEDKTRNIPVIILTSRSEDRDKAIGQEVGADAYTTKPVKIEELLHDVEYLLNQKSKIPHS